MKILNVSSTLDPVTGGGEAERSFQMSRFLHEAKIDCQVLTIDIGLDVERKGFLGNGGVKVLPCLYRRFYVPRTSFSEIDSMVEKVDLIHLMGHWSILNALVYLSIRKCNKPYVVCPAGSLQIFGRSIWFKKIYNFFIGKKIIKNASMCIAVTADEKALFVSYGVDKDRIQVIPNGIAETDFLANNDTQFREKYGLGLKPFILFVGRLNLIKGPDLLLKAFCQIENDFPDVNMVFAGPDGGMKSELENITQSNGLESRIFFVGYLGGIDKSHAYHAAHFLAIPSRHEAMSIVVLEAGVCGTPVLLTDQCGFNQIADINGGWVVSATIDGLRDGLVKVLSAQEGVDVAALKIKKYVVDNFSWNAVVEKFIRLYDLILKNRSNESAKGRSGY